MATLSTANPTATAAPVAPKNATPRNTQNRIFSRRSRDKLPRAQRSKSAI
jgi:hypothetical protein